MSGHFAPQCSHRSCAQSSNAPRQRSLMHAGVKKNPFATPRRADPPPSPTLQRIWTPLDTCGHPLSKSYSRVSYIILSSYLYFWTLWILLCRYFVRRRRKLFYENVFWKTRSTFPKWVRGVQNMTPHDKTIHETRELRLDTPCPPTDTGSIATTPRAT